MNTELMEFKPSDIYIMVNNQLIQTEKKKKYLAIQAINTPSTLTNLKASR
jgi:hypothetical protein